MGNILIAECKQEVSSFNPVRSGRRDFVVRRGQEVFDYHEQPSRRTEVAGALDALVFDARHSPTPVYSARAITSGGTLSRAAFERIAGEFLDSLRKAEPAIGVYFALHGAMAAEGEDDPEGFLLEESRRILGEEIPIVVSLDLHGILTERMIRHSDAIVAFHTYPHVDFFETGTRAAKLLLDIVKGKVRPLTARVRIPMLVRGDELVTETGSFGQVVQKAIEFEGRGPGRSAAVMIGNPFTDVPALRTNSLAVSNNDRDAAVRCATRLARGMWARREGMQATLTALPQAAEIALETHGTTVLMDAADATSSGASGDSCEILIALQEAGFHRKVLAPVVDPSAVDRAFAAGVGGRIRGTVGGSLDPGRFRRMKFHGRVKMLSDGAIRSESFGNEWHAGRTAVVDCGATVLVVTSRPVSLFDRALFLGHGQDPRRFDAVVVKSPHCEPHMYKDWCERLVNVDAPGATSANLHALGHTRCARPVFPLDRNVEFSPEVTVFQRDRYR